MYDIERNERLVTILRNNNITHFKGELLWVNNSTIPSVAHGYLCKGITNERVTFKGVVKNGVSELMVIQHRIPFSKAPMTSAMLGIVSDSVVRCQR